MYTRSVRGWAKHADFILWDVLALELAYVVACVQHNGALPFAASSYRVLAVMYIALDFFVAVVFNTMHNVLKRGMFKELRKTMEQVLFVLLGVTLVLFAVHVGDNYSRVVVFMTAGLHFVFGYASRQFWKRVVLRVGDRQPKDTMILVANEADVPTVVGNLLPADRFAFNGVVLSNRDAEGEEVCGIPVVANLGNAADYLCREWVDGVFVYPDSLRDLEVERSAARMVVEEFSTGARAERGDSYTVEYDGTSVGTAHADEGPEEDEPTVGDLIEQCRQMAIPVHVHLPLGNMSGKNFVETMDGFNVLTIASSYLSPLQSGCKRALDIVGGLVGSIFAVLIIIVVGPLIKIASPGPILFKQTRIGQNGKRFQMYKIRSMYLDAEERKAELMAQNRVSDGMMFKIEWDPRIIGNRIVDGQRKTGIGEFVRSTSLDEFPQFFNVLMGHMSLVGTRPPTVDEWDKYQYHHRARLATKPGITGLWQVSGRSKITDFEEVVALDTEYIQNWSMGLDLKILLRTVRVVLEKTGAM